MKREMKDIVKTLRSQGWTVTLTRSNHYRCQSPSGASTWTPSTPSDHRGIKNLRADLRRLGAVL